MATAKTPKPADEAPVTDSGPVVPGPDDPAGPVVAETAESDDRGPDSTPAVTPEGWPEPPENPKDVKINESVTGSPYSTFGRGGAKSHE